MYTNQIIKNLLKYRWSRRVFCGVKPLDKIPQRRVRRPCSFVVNTDKSDQPGEHWFGIFVPRRGQVEYFDSYGRPPQHGEVLTFIRLNGNKFKYNTKRIQSNESQNCGQFTLFFIYFRSKGYTMDQYMKIYSNIDYQYNDQIIEKLYNKMCKR